MTFHKGITGNDGFIKQQRRVSSQKSVGILDIIKHIEFGTKKWDL